MGAFWATGFEATTLEDLEAATGVGRSTLYNSFGGKSGLYRLATDAYLHQMKAHLFAPLYKGTDDGLADIVEFLGRLRDGLVAPDAPGGCLIVNDMAAGSEPDAARRYQQLLADGLDAALRRGTRSGHPDHRTIPDRVRLISAAVIGINLVSGQSNGPHHIDDLINAAIAEVSAWRQPII